MKKTIALLLSIILLLSLCACGGASNAEQEPEDTKVDLTTENIRDYLKIEASSNDYQTEVGSETIFNIFPEYSGTGTVKISIINQASTRFENVSIKLKVKIPLHSTWNEEEEKYDCNSGWEFDTENVRSESFWSNGLEKGWDNTKEFIITLPYDGNWSISEGLHYKTYAWTLYRPTLEPRFSIDILEVSGTAIVPYGYTPPEKVVADTVVEEPAVESAVETPAP